MSLNRRPCNVCNSYFKPSGKHTKMCTPCVKARRALAVERSKKIAKIAMRNLNNEN